MCVQTANWNVCQLEQAFESPADLEMYTIEKYSLWQLFPVSFPRDSPFLTHFALAWGWPVPDSLNSRPRQKRPRAQKHFSRSPVHLRFCTCPIRHARRGVKCRCLAGYSMLCWWLTGCRDLRVVDRHIGLRKFRRKCVGCLWGWVLERRPAEIRSWFVSCHEIGGKWQLNNACSRLLDPVKVSWKNLCRLLYIWRLRERPEHGVHMNDDELRGTKSYSNWPLWNRGLGRDELQVNAMWALAGILMVFWCGFGEISLEAWVCTKTRFCGSAVIRVTLSQQKLLFATVVQHHGGPNTRRHHSHNLALHLLWDVGRELRAVRSSEGCLISGWMIPQPFCFSWEIGMTWIGLLFPYSIVQISANGYRTMLVPWATIVQPDNNCLQRSYA